MSFKEYLKNYFREMKKKIKEKNVVLCMGNEACDLDSFICSLVVALHDKAIHVVNMNREVFMAKGEIRYILDQFEIDPDDLIYLEKPIGDFSTEARMLGTKFNCYQKRKGEYLKNRFTSHHDKLTLSESLSDKIIKLIIVDHNCPIIELKNAEIDLIIDHHQLIKSSIKARRIYVDTDVGSCSTLVSKYIGHSLITDHANKHKDFETDFFCKSIAHLLLVPIIIDTANVKKRASHFDLGEFEKLLETAKVKGKQMKELRKGIKKERLNDEGLKSDIIMLKDFKMYHYKGLSWGCATVKFPYESWVDRESQGQGNGGILFDSYLTTFRRNMGLDFLFVNRKYKNNRYIIINNCTFERMVIEENNFETLNYKGLRYYSIDVTLSRKILMPIIQKKIDELYKKVHNNEKMKEKMVKEKFTISDIKEGMKLIENEDISSSSD